MLNWAAIERGRTGYVVWALLIATIACSDDHGGDTRVGSERLNPFSGPRKPNTTPANHQLDLFGQVGHHFWLTVSDDQLRLINERAFTSLAADDEQQTTPSDSAALEREIAPTYCDHIVVTAAGAKRSTADYGKVEVRIVGQQRRAAWTSDSSPSLKLDFDEFVQRGRLDGYEHLRLNTTYVGGIFRERLTLDLYRVLGYPAPLANSVWVSSNVWEPTDAERYILVESYKPEFCKRRADVFGGPCVNMWELVGDFGSGDLSDVRSCQFDSCDNERVSQFENLVLSTAPGPGFMATLAGWIDWPAYHRFQCLSWVLSTGDDAIHHGNNWVLVERADGRFQYLPYSVDISLGEGLSGSVSLPGTNELSEGCQSDPECWARTLAVCETVVAQFRAADPVGMLDRLYESLTQHGMVSWRDRPLYEQVRIWLDRRVTELPQLLEQYRE